ncbi:hypothetical protein BP6252_13799 [Coleophoma cylindrospora]|uniref:Uncharacterized protein n=1 Tax=Coleophoma cylindrospora TaxID=1849047 RepID=A0A3D8Q6L6_9HELO|nr:hypothetical protein BP6252_13799 [Coleophoma cylindrospora]
MWTEYQSIEIPPFFGWCSYPNKLDFLALNETSKVNLLHTSTPAQQEARTLSNQPLSLSIIQFFFRHGHEKRGRETNSDSDDLHEDAHTEVDGVVAIEGAVDCVPGEVTEGAVEKTYEHEGARQPNGDKDARLGPKRKTLSGMAHYVEHYIPKGEQRQCITSKEKSQRSLHQTIDGHIVGGGSVIKGAIGADDTNNEPNEGKQGDKNEGSGRDTMGDPISICVLPG